MRIAILSDIHGNLTAFEAVAADLRQTSPDLVLHGGDLDWPGVAGNTDEMLFDPPSRLQTVNEPATVRPGQPVREWLLAVRMAFLRREVARIKLQEFASAESRGEARRRMNPAPRGADFSLRGTSVPPVRGFLQVSTTPVVVYGPIHRPFVRALRALTGANSGSASRPHAGWVARILETAGPQMP